MTKYAVEAFSDALRREIHPWGIKVTMLEPGFFPTNIADPDFLERELRKGWNHISEELKNDYGEEYLQRGTDSYLCLCDMILYLNGPYVSYCWIIGFLHFILLFSVLYTSLQAIITSFALSQPAPPCPGSLVLPYCCCYHYYCYYYYYYYYYCYYCYFKQQQYM